MNIYDNEFELDKEIETSIKEGPTFNQSNFQTNVFNISKHNADARAYRQVLLELSIKYTALKKSKINRKKINAEISILERDLKSEEDEFKKIIIECDIQNKQLDLDNEEKLILDAIRECNSLYSIFKNLPKYTAEEFEKQESEYWKKRLLLDAELSILSHGRIESGLASSLIQVGYNPIQVQTEILLSQDNTIKQLIEQKNNLLVNKEQSNA